MSLSEETDQNFRRGARAGKTEIPDDFLAVHVSMALAGKTLSGGLTRLEEIQTSLDEGRKPATIDFPDYTATLSIQKRNEAGKVRARNVAGYIPAAQNGDRGNDKEQWIIIGAHHDHLGSYTGRGDTIYNGADDNASGVSAVLELAEFFGRDGKASRAQNRSPIPPANLLFITFSAEEVGLLGSRYFVSENTPSAETIVTMINLDMIGRNPDDTIRIHLDPELAPHRKRIEEANSELELPLEFSHSGESFQSDHFPFFRNGVDTVSFFTGLHDDYHQESDHADEIDYSRMETITKLAAETIMKIAED